jgi:glycosyltransferase involved in cell wall biosynthesis
MAAFPIFLTVVYIVHNQSEKLNLLLKRTVLQLNEMVSDYELIIVDNASTDKSIEILKSLTGQEGYPNIQVYALTKEVDSDTASWVGAENALGDFVAVIDPLTDDISFLPEMLQQSLNGFDIVFAQNQLKQRSSYAYHFATSIFNGLYKWICGIQLKDEASHYRVLSKRVINFILQYPQPTVIYKHLPATAGFPRINMEYSSPPQVKQKKKLGDGVDKGIRLLVSTTQTPMRLVTALSLFGASSNMIYSVYVLAVGIFKEDVAPGWVSLSLQQSGMFFLISLVLLVLGEYILNMARLTNEGPLYHVGQEFTSARMGHRERLNVEVFNPSLKPLVGENNSEE